MIRTVLLSGLLLAAVIAKSQDDKHRRKDVILSPKEGPAMLHQCSRGAPQNVTEFWEVTQADVDTLWTNYQKALLPSGNLPRVESSGKRVYQYVGLVINGRRFIYVNACFTDCPDWQSKACVVCDGGPSYWGILFNCSSKEFSGHSSNGVA